MKLRIWREIKGLSRIEIARRVGVADPSVVRKWECGAQVPRSSQMRTLYLLTGGAVQPNDFYELPEIEEAA